MGRLNADARPSGWHVAVDVGGTFVDIAARRESAVPELRLAKRLRSSVAPAASVLEALEAFLAEEEILPGEVASLRHGTTVATNALVELTEAPVVLVTTRGFADVLTLGRQSRRDLAAPRPAFPVPAGLCPETMRVEAGGRFDASGREVEPLGAAEIERVVENLLPLMAGPGAPPAVAVCLLFAHLDPAHELAIAAALRARWPGLHLSLSHEVDPHPREFERTLATVLDAYLRPRVGGYLAEVSARVRALGLPAPWVMRSQGGLAPAAAGAGAPATLAMSGPAAAAVEVGGAAAAAFGEDRWAIGLDLGGTTTDLSLGRGRSLVTTGSLALGALDLRVRSVDILSVPIGGGSLVGLAGGALSVGPRSAGGRPGPACYARGGTDPTLTDACLVAGLLPDRLGELALDREAAARSLAALFGRLDPEGLESAATAIVEVAESALAEAILRKAAADGVDPAETVIVAAGGAGALHAASIAAAIGARAVLVPPHPGFLAAFGLLSVGASDLAEQALDRPLDGDAMAEVSAIAARQAGRLRATLAGWGVPTPGLAIETELELAYQGQGQGLAVGFRPDRDSAGDLAARFDDTHRRVRGEAFGRARRIRTVRTIARESVETRSAAARPRAVPAEPGPRPTRRLFLPEPVACPVWRRDELGAGQDLAGPALVDAADTSVVIPPGWTAAVRTAGSLVLTRAQVPW